MITFHNTWWISWKYIKIKGLGRGSHKYHTRLDINQDEMKQRWLFSSLFCVFWIWRGYIYSESPLAFMQLGPNSPWASWEGVGSSYMWTGWKWPRFPRISGADETLHESVTNSPPATIPWRPPVPSALSGDALSYITAAQHPQKHTEMEACGKSWEVSLNEHHWHITGHSISPWKRLMQRKEIAKSVCFIF